MAVEKFPIEAGQVMMFARAIGDANPLYYDAEAAKNSEAGSIIAPPTFVFADMHFDPTAGLRPRIGERWFGSGREPSYPRERAAADPSALEGPSSDGQGTGLHAEEHFEYLRPVRVGDVLTKTSRPGESWEREGRRGGKLRFAELINEYRDQNGDLVLIARQIGVQTERAVGDD